MPNDDYDKTIKISSLDDLSGTEEEKTEEENNPKEEEVKGKKTKKENKLKKWWNNQPKKKKRILIISTIIFVLAIAICVILVLNNLKKEPIEEEEIEDIVVELENYRYQNGTLIFLNSAGEEIGSYKCTNEDENLCYVAYYSLEDDFDIPKKEYEDGTTILDRIPIVNDTYVFIKDVKSETDDTIKIYNIKENKELDETYRLVKKASESEDTFILKNNMSSYGIIKLSDRVENVINFNYDYLGYMSGIENKYIAQSNNRQIIIDKNGKNLSKTITGNVTYFNDKYIKVKNEDNSYSVIDYSGNTIYSDYDYIDLYDDYVFLIKDSKLMVKDYDNNKYHEEEIILYNKEYIKTSIYDENKKLVETKEAYNIEENDNNIIINVIKSSDTKTTSISKLEENLSKNIKYINYFDGKLYFYSDEDKTDLLGTYTCTNKNNLTTSPDSLVNCSIAKDTVFEDNDVSNTGTSSIIPIINERFVFINDNPDLVSDSTQNIILYDLKKGSAVSKYNMVNTYSYTGLDEVSFKTVNENYVVCKNQSGKFGVVKIGLSEVSASIPFTYNSLEKIGDYYEVSDSSGYYLISTSNGEKLTSSIPNKIRNYNDDYVTVLDSDNYYVYDYEGNKISNNGYKYIGLYDMYYAAVTKDNKLNLYYYSNPDTPLLSENITLNLQNYYGTGMLAFRISGISTNITIEVGNANKTYDSYTFTLGKEDTE